MDAGVDPFRAMDAGVTPPSAHENPHDGTPERPYSLDPNPPRPRPPTPITEPTLEGSEDRPYSITGEDPEGEWMSAAPRRGQRSAPLIPSFARPAYGVNVAEFFDALDRVRQVAGDAVPLIAQYEDAANDPTLTGFMVRDDDRGDLNQMALRQPRNADGNGPAIGDLFPGNADRHELSAGEGRALADAVPRAQAIRHQVVSIEGQMQTQRSAISAALHEHRAAALRYEAEQARGHAVAAEQRATEAQAGVTRVTERRENWRTGVRWVLRAVEVAAAVVAGMPAAGGGAVAAEGAAASTASRVGSSSRSVVAGLGSNAVHDSLGAAADAIIDAVFASDLRNAQAEVDRHHAEARRQVDTARQRDLDAAREAMAGALDRVTQAQDQMRRLATDRRNHLRQLADAVVPPGAQAGNGDAQNARSMVSAIPVAETVVSRLRQINARLTQLPGPTRAAQTGAYAMLPGQRSQLRDLGAAYAQLRGWQEEFGALEGTWSTRLASLRLAFDRLDHVDPRMHER